MGDLFGISVEQKIACLERELGYRRRVYANRIAEGKMTQKLADREISVMEAILADYRKPPATLEGPRP